MERHKIKQIGAYLKNLEESLTTGNSSHVSLQAEIPTLYKTIELLMDATFKTKDQKLKPVLAYMEMRLRKCKQKIEERLGIMN